MNSKLIIYVHNFCADAICLRGYLNQSEVAYEWRDIVEGDPYFKKELCLLARGGLSVPTVVFPEGEVMGRPKPKEIFARLKGEFISAKDIPSLTSAQNLRLWSMQALIPGNLRHG